MKKLGVLLITFIVVVVGTVGVIQNIFSKSNDGSLGVQTCVIDSNKVDESLADEEREIITSLNDSTFKNETVIIYKHEGDTSTLQQVIGKVNELVSYAESIDYSLSKSVMVQSYAYGTDYLDAMSEFKLYDADITFNQEYESKLGIADEQSKTAYYVEIQTEANKEFCIYGVSGLPVDPPYQITGWFPAYNADGTGGYHDGIDFGLDIGTPVFSTHSGEVVLTASACQNNGSMNNDCGGYADDGMAGIFGLGNFVIIKVDGQDTFLAYAHLSAPLVKKGDMVTLGQQIGLSGNSGQSTGSHLHYVVAFSSNMYDVVNSRAVTNPCDFVQQLCIQ